MKDMKEFMELMEIEIEKHQAQYGDSWKSMSIGKLFDRLDNKVDEFDLTMNKQKLISVANLAMFLYIRMKKEGK